MIDFTGQVFVGCYEAVAYRRHGNSPYGWPCWVCCCLHCGTRRMIPAGNLRRGKVRPCPCQDGYAPATPRTEAATSEPNVVGHCGIFWDATTLPVTCGRCGWVWGIVVESQHSLATKG